MNPAEIRELVSDEKYWGPNSKFIAIDKDEVLWFDGEDEIYCINKFAIDDGKVHFSPMPHQSFQ
jgi:hypothetical protein